MTDQSKAAPAPSSLAGGEEAEFATALARVLDRHGLRDAGWADADIDEALSVVREPSAVSRATVDAILPMISERLAALSPEAPAREKHYGDPCIRCGVGHDNVPPGPCRGDGITISRERARAVLDYLKNGRGPAGWPTQLWVEVQHFIANIEAALTLRHEAPAEGAGEAMTEREVRQWIDACNHEPARQVLRDYLALRARSSAPEAREGEGVGFVTQTGLDCLADGYSAPLRPMTAISGVPGATLLYTHPAAPSADKLRIAVEALEAVSARRVTKLSCDSWADTYSGGHSAASEKCADIADQALAALKAEGAK